MRVPPSPSSPSSTSSAAASDKALAPQPGTPLAKGGSPAAEPFDIGAAISSFERVAGQVGHAVANALHKAEVFAGQYLHPLGGFHNPDLPASLPDPGGLRMASYNVKDGGADLAGIERDLASQKPDVVCLQECSKESAVALAKKLGYHAAFYDSPVHSYGGNAILSRYPIAKTEAIPFHNPMTDRVQAFFHELAQHRPGTSMFDQRMMLHVTLQVGDRKVDVVDTHLTLLDAPGNTQNLLELKKTLEGLEAQGHTVIAAGDMNTNFALARGGTADPAGTRATPTDTAAELMDRYGKGPSNIGDAADLRAAQALLAGQNYFWDAAKREVLVDGKAITPEQAQALLDGGTVPKGSVEEKRLQLAVDGATLGGGDRLDNLFASKNVRFTSALIDQTTHASDHRPIFADVRWD